jgi:hypothetical protein
VRSPPTRFIRAQEEKGLGKAYRNLFSNSAEGFMKSHLEGGTFLSAAGFSLRLRASSGQVDTHSPHPMQRFRLTSTTSSPRVMASIWHLSTQIPQAVHSSAFNCA